MYTFRCYAKWNWVGFSYCITDSQFWADDSQGNKSMASLISTSVWSVISHVLLKKLLHFSDRQDVYIFILYILFTQKRLVQVFSQENNGIIILKWTKKIR